MRKRDREEKEERKKSKQSINIKQVLSQGKVI
jgi:hypothetical protein